METLTIDLTLIDHQSLVVASAKKMSRSNHTDRTCSDVDQDFAPCLCRVETPHLFPFGCSSSS